MNEIEKLYENAGIEKMRNCKGCEYEEEYICPDNCPQQQLKYSPFTAEKQIELIKWLTKYDEIHGDCNNDEYGFATYNYSGKYKKDFEESLASVINNELWQNLTKEEKEQVKGILNE